VTLEEIDAEIAAQQRRLCSPEIRTKQQVDAVRDDVDKAMRRLLSMRGAKVKRLAEGGG